MAYFYELSRVDSAKHALRKAAPLVTGQVERTEVKDALRNLANGVELLLKEFLSRRHPLFIYKKVDFQRLVCELEEESDAAEDIDESNLSRSAGSCNMAGMV